MTNGKKPPQGATTVSGKDVSAEAIINDLTVLSLRMAETSSALVEFAAYLKSQLGKPPMSEIVVRQRKRA